MVIIGATEFVKQIMGLIRFRFLYTFVSDVNVFQRNELQWTMRLIRLDTVGGTKFEAMHK